MEASARTRLERIALPELGIPLLMSTFYGTDSILAVGQRYSCITFTKRSSRWRPLDQSKLMGAVGLSTASGCASRSTCASTRGNVQARTAPHRPPEHWIQSLSRTRRLMRLVDAD